MKKLFILLLITLSLPALAQEKKVNNFYMGLGGNFNTVWLSNQNTYGEPELDYKLKFGYGVNLNLGYDFNEHAGLKMEIGYMTMGEDYEDTQYDLPTTRSIDMAFLQVPLLFKFHTGKFYIAAGPQLNILLSAKQEYLRGGETPPDYNGIAVGQEDIKDRYQKVQGFIRGDIGFDFPLNDAGSWFLNTGLSGAFGITDANAPDWRFYDTTQDYYISHNLYLGINIGISHKF